VANAGEVLGYSYGSPEFLAWLEEVLRVFRDDTYKASALLAEEKGAFPLYDAKYYLKGAFIKTLSPSVQKLIKKHGIRNSHLLSIAPTGTISLTADNVSSGIEPVFSHEYERTIQTFDGPVVETVSDYAYRLYGTKGKTAMQCTAAEHLSVLALSSQFVDSAVSKTINVDPSTPWEDFKNIYTRAWELGCKGVTTYNPSGKRFGILNVINKTDEPQACYIDVETGIRSCD